MENYIARQPILDDKQTLIAYELLYRKSEVNQFCSEENEARLATGSSKNNFLCCSSKGSVISTFIKCSSLGISKQRKLSSVNFRQRDRNT